MLKGLKIINSTVHIDHGVFTAPSELTSAQRRQPEKNRADIGFNDGEKDSGLKADGHYLILEMVTHWNAVDQVVNREMAFHCNVYDLDFGGDGKLDSLCEEARKAVLNS
nr:UPF0728 protein C10orf53 homolog [Taeniopygia guttata]